MRTYQVRLIGVESCGSDIRTFRFERPDGFAFTAGQWTRLTLESAQGPETKTFTLCSAPQDPYLEITTRMSDSVYKVALGALDDGDLVTVSAAAGRLTLPDDIGSVAFLAGGVGITPVRSMLRDARARDRRFDDALLVYGSRDDACVPFLDEFLDMRDSGVRVVEVYEHPSSGWTGERGFITARIVRGSVDPADGRPFYVAGPPPMVNAMTAVLDELGVEPTRRRVELFGGAGA